MKLLSILFKWSLSLTQRRPYITKSRHTQHGTLTRQLSARCQKWSAWSSSFYLSACPTISAISQHKRLRWQLISSYRRVLTKTYKAEYKRPYRHFKSLTLTSQPSSTKPRPLHLPTQSLPWITRPFWVAQYPQRVSNSQASCLSIQTTFLSLNVKHKVSPRCTAVCALTGNHEAMCICSYQMNWLLTQASSCMQYTMILRKSMKCCLSMMPR